MHAVADPVVVAPNADEAAVAAMVVAAAMVPAAVVAVIAVAVVAVMVRLGERGRPADQRQRQSADEKFVHGVRPLRRATAPPPTIGHSNWAAAQRARREKVSPRVAVVDLEAHPGDAVGWQGEHALAEASAAGGEQHRAAGKLDPRPRAAQVEEAGDAARSRLALEG